MKFLKKRRLIKIIILIIFIIVLIIVSGFIKRYDVVITDFIDKEGEMELDIALTSPVGCARSVKAKNENNRKYLTFYNNFSFPNGGSTCYNKFNIKVEDECDEIYLYDSNDHYYLVLRKDLDTNTWNLLK